MASKWKGIVGTSFGIIIVSIIVTVVLILPHYKLNRLFDSIDNGKWTAAVQFYDSLSDKDKEHALSYMDDYAKYLCNEYVSGEKEYEETIASLDAMNAISDVKPIVGTYMENVCKNQFRQSLDNLSSSNLSLNNSKSFEEKQRLEDIVKRLSYDVRESIMIQGLNENFQHYVDGTMTYGELLAFASVVQTMSYYDAYEYADVIVNNAGYVEMYRALYSSVETEYSLGNYEYVLETCSMLQIPTKDSVYTVKYSEVYESAYNDGKAYYQNKLEELSSGDDMEAFVILLNEVRRIYGEDFDVSNYVDSIMEPWMTPYISFISDFESNIPDGYSTSDYNTFSLYDIDNNGTPELFIYNVDNINMQYISCLVFGYSSGNVKFIDKENILNLCSNGYLLVFPAEYVGNASEAYSLLEFSNNSFTEVASCREEAGVYYSNGSEVSDVAYLGTYSDILDYMSQEAFISLGYSSFADAETFIMTY